MQKEETETGAGKIPGKGAVTMSDVVKCPSCGSQAEHPAAIHQVASGVIDVGWRCVNCSHEWGFEVYEKREGGEG